MPIFLDFMRFFRYNGSMEKREKTVQIPQRVYEDFLKQAQRIAELEQQVRWLAEQTARASAIYYSLTVSARENGLVPFEYLSRIFTEAPNGAEVESLMPWRP